MPNKGNPFGPPSLKAIRWLEKVAQKEKILGIGGSSSNPPHLGHFKLLSYLITCGFFDKIIWVITGERADKKYTVSPDDRVTMTEFTLGCFRKSPKIKFSLNYSDAYKENTPTITLLEKFKKEFPDYKVVFIAGSDLVYPRLFPGCEEKKCEIERFWFKGKELLETWPIYIIQRENYEVDFKEIQTRIKSFYLPNYKISNISSTEIREKCKTIKRESRQFYLNPFLRKTLSTDVIYYIFNENLYR